MWLLIQLGYSLSMLVKGATRLDSIAEQDMTKQDMTNNLHLQRVFSSAEFFQPKIENEHVRGSYMRWAYTDLTRAPILYWYVCATV